MRLLRLVQHLLPSIKGAAKKSLVAGVSSTYMNKTETSHQCSARANVAVSKRAGQPWLMIGQDALYASPPATTVLRTDLSASGATRTGFSLSTESHAARSKSRRNGTPGRSPYG